jgi:hypothetical protein
MNEPETTEGGVADTFLEKGKHTPRPKPQKRKHK